MSMDILFRNCLYFEKKKKKTKNCLYIWKKKKKHFYTHLSLSLPSSFSPLSLLSYSLVCRWLILGREPAQLMFSNKCCLHGYQYSCFKPKISFLISTVHNWILVFQLRIFKAKEGFISNNWTHIGKGGREEREKDKDERWRDGRS